VLSVSSSRSHLRLLGSFVVTVVTIVVVVKLELDLAWLPVNS